LAQAILAEGRGGPSAMLQAGAAFLTGYACRTSCASLPCHARFNTPGRTVKLSIVVHSATLAQVDGGSLFQNQRPFVGVTAGDCTKETEHGDWSREKGHWCFREMITVVANVNEDLAVFVSCSTKYNLYVASVSLTSRRMGEICLPVTQILSRLKVEDRDAEGLIYVTPVLDLDVTQDGKQTGRLRLSFETKTAPPSHKHMDADRCCGWGGGSAARYSTDDDIVGFAPPVSALASPPGLPHSSRHCAEPGSRPSTARCISAR